MPDTSQPAIPIVSVLIPAHDEQRVIDRALSCLLGSAQPGQLEVLVVANGCQDATADVAGRHPGVDVLELPTPGKPAAQAAGDRRLTAFPRIYLDADVELDTVSALALAERLRSGDVLAAAPRRELDLVGSSWPVRAYHRLWEQLPSVQGGIFGRGVIAVNEAGHEALRGHAGVVNDDGRADALLHDQAVVVPEATVRIRCPRSTGALLRRRARTARGNTELRQLGTPSTSTADTVRDIARLVVANPRMLPAAGVFVTLTLVGRFVGRWQRSTATTSWGRDDSSRA